MTVLQANPGKNIAKTVDGTVFLRIPIKTKLVTPKDALPDVIAKYALPHIAEGDTLVLSEKMVAITEGNVFPIDAITPSRGARFFSRFVTKSPYGIGVSIPETMELAIRAVGLSRIVIAAFIAALTKPVGIKGMFYRIAGQKVRGIDGPVDYAIPPYNRYASAGPKNPKKTASVLSKRFGAPFVIIDANDLGVNVLGASQGVDSQLFEEIFRDNPLGQEDQSTPIAIVRLATPQ